MLSWITTGAYNLDQWLKAHVGPLYNTILASTLGLGIVASVNTLTHVFKSTEGLAAVIGTAAVQVALLINQLGQLHEYRQLSRERRAARRVAKAARKADRGSSLAGGDAEQRLGDVDGPAAVERLEG